ncbi:MAG: cytochrome c maturation protein CcmE [Candidatus Cloacimonadota bacterium]|nr:MAG: cytochrome c maturation protein CcmE [Candidatus Cloacimonadota bacterium]
MKRLKYIIGIIIIIVCIVFLAVKSFRKTGVYYLTVSEVNERKDSLKEKPFRVDGMVVSGSIEWNPEKLLLKFELTDGKEKLPVFHKGIKPDLLGDGKEIVVEGTLGKDGIFNAAKLITKCPSKYKPAKK